MRYAISSYKKSRLELAYRIYVTDSLQALAQNKYIKQRWYDAVKPERIDPRSGEEIARDILSRAGIEVIST